MSPRSPRVITDNKSDQVQPQGNLFQQPVKPLGLSTKRFPEISLDTFHLTASAKLTFDLPIYLVIKTNINESTRCRLKKLIQQYLFNTGNKKLSKNDQYQIEYDDGKTETLVLPNSLLLDPNYFDPHAPTAQSLLEILPNPIIQERSTVKMNGHRIIFCVEQGVVTDLNIVESNTITKVIQSSGEKFTSDETKHIVREFSNETVFLSTNVDLPFFRETKNNKKQKAYLVKEKIPGKDLFCHIENGHKFTLKKIAHIALEVISQLKILHKKNYIHRDIKLENIMFKPGKDLKVTLMDHEFVAELTENKKPLDFIGFGTPDYQPRIIRRKYERIRKPRKAKTNVANGMLSDYIDKSNAAYNQKIPRKTQIQLNDLYKIDSHGLLVIIAELIHSMFNIDILRADYRVFFDGSDKPQKNYRFKYCLSELSNALDELEATPEHKEAITNLLKKLNNWQLKNIPSLDDIEIVFSKIQNDLSQSTSHRFKK